MKAALKVVGGLVVLLVVVAVGFYGWASMKQGALLSRTIETHTVDFAIPFPLTAEEIAELGPEQSADAATLEKLAFERATERGRHLVMARYVCVECHGQNFGGGVMITTR